jgi:sugar phosphate isomerase/epimerase
MDFPPIFRALHEIAYKGAINVELSRHSHKGVEAVRGSAAYLRPFLHCP